MSELKLMTFNLRIKGKFDGINSVENRAPLMLDMISREAPDIIGFQEAKDDRRIWLREKLFPMYTLLGGGRNADCLGEGCPVAYRTDRFELLEMDTFWLSDTPKVAGSRYENSDQSNCPRVTHALKLKCRDAEEPFVYVNTHLDHEGWIARGRAFDQLAEYMTGLQYKCALGGDFNVRPDHELFTSFIKKMKTNGFSDATEGLPPTFHNFGKSTNPGKIDYIFTNAKITDSRVLTDRSPEGIYLSDHYPVYIKVEI